LVKKTKILPNLSLKADHPPSGFFSFVLSWAAAGVGLAQALGEKDAETLLSYFSYCTSTSGSFSAW
jgi:hypothetical protein